LHLAIVVGNLELVNLLLSKGANMESVFQVLFSILYFQQGYSILVYS